MNPILTAFFSSDLFGKIIFISIFSLSILTWAILLQKYFMQRDARRNGEAFSGEFLKNSFNLVPEEEHPFAILYGVLRRHTIDLLGKNQSEVLSASDLESLRTSLSHTSSSQTKQLQKHLFVLSTIVSLAPFLGLLGTVWGILLTLGELQAGGSLSGNAAIMGDLSMALGTTVFGLLVAIPALIAYNYLRASISHFSAEMDDFSQEMLTTVEKQYRKVDV